MNVSAERGPSPLLPQDSPGSTHASWLRGFTHSDTNRQYTHSAEVKITRFTQRHIKSG